MSVGLALAVPLDRGLVKDRVFRPLPSFRSDADSQAVLLTDIRETDAGLSPGRGPFGQ